MLCEESELMSYDKGQQSKVHEMWEVNGLIVALY